MAVFTPAGAADDDDGVTNDTLVRASVASMPAEALRDMVVKLSAKLHASLYWPARQELLQV